jgi:uncharacterized membrane protein
MKVYNPFTVNDWPIKDFLLTVLVIQFSVLALIALDAVGVTVPILRQLCTFIYLVFVPGLLLLRTLKIHGLGSVETLLYTVGLSIAALMFIGFFMNAFLPAVGIEAPLSLLSMVVVLTTFVLALSVVSYIRDKNFADTNKSDYAWVLSPSCLFFVLLPFVSTIGAYVMNVYGVNFILMLLLLAIAFAFIVLSSSTGVPSRAYPLAVFSISLSLLLHWSLISSYLTGYDVLVEYFNANVVVQNAVWDPSLSGLYNGVLSVVMLAPMISLMCNLSLTWVFKIVYPVLYSFVPVGLFWLYKKQTDDKIALVSVGLIMSLVSFYGLTMLARQEIGEIFLVATLLLVVDQKIEKTVKTGLFIIFLVALAVSHYSLSYFFIFCLVTALMILSLQKNGAFIKSKARLLSLLGIEDQWTGSVKEHTKARESLVTVGISVIFIVCVLSWYAYISGGSAITSISALAGQISGSLFTDIFNPATSQGTAILSNQPVSPLHALTKYLYLASLSLIMVGLVATWLKPTMRLNREISAFYPPVCALLIAGIAIPYVAGALSTDRLLHIALIFVAPLLVLGALAIASAIASVVSGARARKRIASDNTRKFVLGGLSVFLALFLLLNSGLIYEVVHDNPTSIALNKMVVYPVFNDKETAASLWLQNETQSNPLTYVDALHYTLLVSMQSSKDVRELRLLNSSQKFFALKNNAYIFFGTTNIVNKEIYVVQNYANNIAQSFTVSASPIIDNRSLVYNNGGAQVYYSPNDFNATIKLMHSG